MLAYFLDGIVFLNWCYCYTFWLELSTFGLFQNCSLLSIIFSSSLNFMPVYSLQILSEKRCYTHNAFLLFAKLCVHGLWSTCRFWNRTDILLPCLSRMNLVVTLWALSVFCSLYAVEIFLCNFQLTLGIFFYISDKILPNSISPAWFLFSSFFIIIISISSVICFSPCFNSSAAIWSSPGDLSFSTFYWISN